MFQPVTMLPSTTTDARRVFMVLSPRSLVYARYALQSLFRNALETIDLHLITDSAEDKDLLLEEMTLHQPASPHRWTIHTKDELNDLEAARFTPHRNLRYFRKGHPCWRKITDPLLLSNGNEEIVVLDPDLYFPNRFSFEQTPDRGLLLMWQKPTCLLPAPIVQTALLRNIGLAHHVDIGVSQWRADADLSWLDWLVGALGLEDYPKVEFFMHVEAIVWAAIAMRVGGGYLSPELWHCWRRSQPVRLLRKLGVPGYRLIKNEPFSAIKCFHATAESKYWVEAAERRGWLECGNTRNEPAKTLPFVELTSGIFQRDQALKSWVRKSGYYRLFPFGSLR
jgi:hypothetical protein